MSHASIDNAGAYDPNGGWAGGSQMYPTKAGVTRATRTATHPADLPGWVQYAFNHGGASALQDPARAQLYRNRLAELLKRFDPSNVTVDVPSGGGLNF